MRKRVVFLNNNRPVKVVTVTANSDYMAYWFAVDKYNQNGWKFDYNDMCIV